MNKTTLTIASKNYGSWSLRGWLLCKMAGLDFEEQHVGADDPSTRAELLLLSPSFLVPCLFHDGIKVWDTLAIAQYLHEIKPDAGLLPADRAQRAHCRAISGEMHSGFANLRSALPMNLKAHFPGFKAWAGARGDIERVTAIWRECLQQYGGPLFIRRKAVRGRRHVCASMHALCHLRCCARRALGRLLPHHHGAAADARMDRGRKTRTRRAGRARRRVLIQALPPLCARSSAWL